MTPQEAEFVKFYVAGTKASDAMRKAGYSEAEARTKSGRLLSKKAVKAEIDRIKSKAAEKAEFNIEAAYREVCELIDEAKKEGQFTAVSSLFQTKVKLFGLLTEKVQHSGDAGFRLNIVGIGQNGQPAIPATFEDVPSEPAKELPAPDLDKIFED